MAGAAKLRDFGAVSQVGSLEERRAGGFRCSVLRGVIVLKNSTICAEAQRRGGFLFNLCGVRIGNQYHFSGARCGVLLATTGILY